MRSPHVETDLSLSAGSYQDQAAASRTSLASPVGAPGETSAHVRRRARPAAARPAPARAPRPDASPSAAATIEPFIRMCHWRAKPVGVLDAGLRGQPDQERRGFRQVLHARHPRRDPPVVDSSSITLMNEQPSKSVRANHSPKTSKIASSRSRGLRARRSTSACSQPRVQRSSRSGQERHDQLVLGREVAVQRHLRRARLGDDPVDADGARPVPAEQLVRRVEDALAGRPASVGG